MEGEEEERERRRGAEREGKGEMRQEQELVRYETQEMTAKRTSETVDSCPI